jgi:hypothetical protein
MHTNGVLLLPRAYEDRRHPVGEEIFTPTLAVLPAPQRKAIEPQFNEIARLL